MPQGKFTVADVDVQANRAPATPEEGEGAIGMLKALAAKLGRNSPLNPLNAKVDMGQLHEMLSRAANPRELGDFAQLLLPSALVGGGEIAGGMAAESADIIGEGAKAATQAMRGPVGRGVQATGRGLTATGEAFPQVPMTLGGAYMVSRHPVIGSAMIAGPAAAKGAGALLRMTGKLIEGAPAAAPKLASLGLNPEEAAIQRALEMLKEQRAAAASAVTKGAEGYGELAPKATGVAQDITKKPPVNYNKYSQQAGADVEDFKPPAGSLSEDGKLIPPSMEEHLAALKAYQAKKYPGRAAAPKPAEPPIYGSPEGIAAAEKRLASEAAAKPPAAAPEAPPATGESLGDLGRAISTDKPATPPAQPPVTDTGAVIEGAQRRHRKRAAGEPPKPAAKGPRSAEAAVGQRAVDTNAAPAAKEVTGGEGAAGSPRVPVRKETPPNPGEGDIPPKPSYTGKDFTVLQRIKRGEQVNPAEMQETLQKLRDALGSEGAAKAAGIPASKIKKLTRSSGNAPTETIRKVLEKAGSITDPAEAEAYLNGASYNIREVLRASFKRRGLIK
jgi:hypothetical protein